MWSALKLACVDVGRSQQASSSHGTAARSQPSEEALPTTHYYPCVYARGATSLCVRWVTAGPHSAKTQLTLFIFVYSALAFGGAREQAVFSVRALRKNQKEPKSDWNGVFCAKFAFDFFLPIAKRNSKYATHTHGITHCSYGKWSPTTITGTKDTQPEHSIETIIGGIAQGRKVVHPGRPIFGQKKSVRVSKNSVKFWKSWLLWSVKTWPRFRGFWSWCIVWLVNNSEWYAGSWQVARQVLPKRGRDFSDRKILFNKKLIALNLWKLCVWSSDIRIFYGNFLIVNPLV